MTNIISFALHCTPLISISIDFSNLSDDARQKSIGKVEQQDDF
jgi:hypothetical protein